MGFFDLNIPYPLEPSPADKASLERQRTKLVVKAMELGYIGIAYNRTIKGVMSDHHRCNIPLLTLSSLLKVAPSLSLSVKLHRELLGTPSAAPFRQYTRLTVCVDNASQAQALNPGNPILKTYDLVAVRPMNQTAFDQACERMEVDIVSIDFSEKLPFRLKQPMVKAAAERGVCFEVTYSGLITDIQVRKQLICNAKLLVDWTRGRNIILSSAASSVDELRGPYDVANLSLLLGLSKEKAKAAISKNCRTLLASSLRKKKYYKEAIRIEVKPSGAPSNSKEAWQKELLQWDPISSGEGDLLLDDLAKSFSSSYKASNTTKAIDFASVIDSIPSHGFQVKDILSAKNFVRSFPDNKDNFLPVTGEVYKSTSVLKNPNEQPTMLDVCPEAEEELYDPIRHPASSVDNLTPKSFRSEHSKAFKLIDEERKAPMSKTKSELESVNYSDENCTHLEANAPEYRSDKCISSSALDDVIPDKNEKMDTSSADAKLQEAQNSDDELKSLTGSLEVDFPTPVYVKHMNESSYYTNSNAQIDKMHGTLPKEDTKIGELTVMEMNDSIPENLMADEQCSKHESEAAELDMMPQQTSHEIKMEDDSSIATHTTTVCTDAPQLARIQPVSGASRVKQRTKGGMHLTPFKRLLNPVPFKRKAKKQKRRKKSLRHEEALCTL